MVQFDRQHGRAGDRIKVDLTATDYNSRWVLLKLADEPPTLAIGNTDRVSQLGLPNPNPIPGPTPAE